jgi:hypothetical protein
MASWYSVKHAMADRSQQLAASVPWRLRSSAEFRAFRGVAQLLQAGWSHARGCQRPQARVTRLLDVRGFNLVADAVQEKRGRFI